LVKNWVDLWVDLKAIEDEAAKLDTDEMLEKSIMF
tara:strand:- start:4953 stop:5057 length:105 start_codon:yes stop_codon:yes gene_type:complete